MSQSDGKPYAVGYRRPPKQHQFEKGRSGNPRGRPKKMVDQAAGQTVTLPGLHDLVLEEALRKVPLREGDKTIELTVIRAAVRSLGLSAMKGDRRSQLAFKDLFDTAQAQVYEERLRQLTTAAEYKGEWQAVFDRCDREGRSRPDVLPHPDDVIIDWKAGEVFLVGPWDAHHRHEWNDARSEREDCIAEIASLKRYARRNPDYAKGADDNIAFEVFFRDMIDLILPDEETRRSPAFDPHRRLAFLKALRKAKSIKKKMVVVKTTVQEMGAAFGGRSLARLRGDASR